jgi:cytosine/adenosine deaminase-related metal-dependent hydrolase
LIDVRPRPWIEEYAFGSWTFFSEPKSRLSGFGLSPHAPYTASAEMYGLALECSRKLSLPVTTHVAESREEYEMFSESRGELYEFLKKLGRPMNDCGRSSPLRQLIQNGLIDADCIAVHLNQLDDRDLELLAKPEWQRLSVVHCPKSHRFLHHSPFPMEALRKRNINVSLGTDSLASNDSLNLFPEMRTARKNYPDLNPKELLEMTTICPAQALKQEHYLGRISDGYLADAIAIPYDGPAAEAYEAILETRHPVQWMMLDGNVL